MRVYKPGTTVELAQQEWQITAVVIRGEKDVKYCLTRNSQSDGRRQLIVYPFEFEVKVGRQVQVDLLDMPEVGDGHA